MTPFEEWLASGGQNIIARNRRPSGAVSGASAAPRRPAGERQIVRSFADGLSPSDAEPSGQNEGFFVDNALGRALGGLIRTVDAPRAMVATMANSARTGGVPGAFAYAPPALLYGNFRGALGGEDARKQFASDFDQRIGFSQATGLDDVDWLPGWAKGTIGFVGDVATDPLLYLGAAPAAGTAATRGAGGGLLRGAMRADAANPLDQALRSGSRKELSAAVLTRGQEKNLIPKGVIPNWGGAPDPATIARLSSSPVEQHAAKLGTAGAEAIAAAGGRPALTLSPRSTDDLISSVRDILAGGPARSGTGQTGRYLPAPTGPDLGKEVVAELSLQAGRRGTGAFTTRGLERTAQAVSAKVGTKVTPEQITSLLDLDVVFGYGFRRPGRMIGGNRLYFQRLGEWRADVFGFTKLKAADLPWSSAFRQVVNNSTYNYNKLVDKVLAGTARNSDEQIETVLSMVDILHARGRERQYAHASVIRLTNALADADPTVVGRRGPMRGAKVSDERMAHIRSELEKGLADPDYIPHDPLAVALRNELDLIHADLTAAGVEVKHRKGYLPHVISPEGRRLVQMQEPEVGASWVRPDSREDFMFARQWEQGDTIQFSDGKGGIREVLIEDVPTIDYINDLFRRELNDPNLKFFADDVFDVVGGYQASAAKQLGRQELVMRVGGRHLDQAIPSKAAVQNLRSQARAARTAQEAAELDSAATRLEARMGLEDARVANESEVLGDFVSDVSTTARATEVEAARIERKIATRENNRAVLESQMVEQTDVMLSLADAGTGGLSPIVNLKRSLSTEKRRRIDTANSLFRQGQKMVEQWTAARDAVGRISPSARRLLSEYEQLSVGARDGSLTTAQYQRFQDMNNADTQLGQRLQSVRERDAQYRQYSEKVAEARQKVSEARALRRTESPAEREVKSKIRLYERAQARFGSLQDQVRDLDMDLKYLYASRKEKQAQLVMLRDFLEKGELMLPPGGNLRRFGKTTEARRVSELREMYKEQAEMISGLYDDPMFGGSWSRNFAEMETRALNFDLVAARKGAEAADLERSFNALRDRRLNAAARADLENDFINYTNEYQLPKSVVDHLQEEVNQYGSTLAAWMKGANASDEAVRRALGIRDGIRKAQNYWKSWAVGSPGFVSRNIQGGLSNMMILDGVTSDSVRVFMKVYRSYARGDVKDSAGNVFTWQERAAAGLARDRQVISEAKRRGMTADELAESLVANEFTTALQVTAATGFGQAPQEVIRGVAATKRRPQAWQLWKADNQWTGSIRDLATHSEAVMRGSHAFHLVRNGGDFANAVERVTKFHFNYADIGKLDRTAKAVIPFWMFFSRNLPLQAQMWTSRPARINRSYFNAKRNFEDTGEQIEDRPAFFREMGLVQTGLRSGGNRLHVGVDLPFMRLQSDVATVVPQPWRIFQDSYPWYKLPVELTTNKNLFYQADFRNEHVVRAVGKDGVPFYRPRTAPAFMNNPILRPLLQHAPGFDQVAGQLTMTDKAENVMRQIPVAQRASGLVFPTERDTPSLSPRWVSFLTGLQMRQNTPEMQQQTRNLAQRDADRQARIDRDRQRALEYVIANR